MTEHVPITNVPTRVKLRVEDYLSLDRNGAFEGYGKTELIDGEVTYMNAQHRPHALAKMALYDALRDGLRAAGSTMHVMVEASVTWAPVDVPEPDLLLTSEPRGLGPVPGTSVSLVIEIADATLQSDLGRKAAIYARHVVSEYWVADVNGRPSISYGHPRTVVTATMPSISSALLSQPPRLAGSPSLPITSDRQRTCQYANAFFCSPATKRSASPPSHEPR